MNNHLKILIIFAFTQLASSNKPLNYEKSRSIVVEQI